MFEDFLSAEMDVAKDAASRGAVQLMSRFGLQSEACEKSVLGENQGLVTVADLESERAITEIINASFPDDLILAEENFSLTDLTGPHRIWVIDPLDGTNNFAHGISHFAISIGLWEHGVPKLGVVYNPVSKSWYMAGAGQGAWCNAQQVMVNGNRSLSQSMIATGFYYDRGAMMRATLATIGDLFTENIQGIRRFGAASLDLIAVGLGHYGGFFEFRLAPWDFAAGALFVTEAGGRVTDCDNKPLSLKTSSILASNSFLHEPLLGIISRHRAFNANSHG